MECPICFEVIINTCQASCNHVFCYRCINKWCLRGKRECPICRTKMFQLVLNKEFGFKNNLNNKTLLVKPPTKLINVNFNDDLGAGITVKERGIYNTSPYNYGVLVSKLEPNKKLKQYLKIGDVILYLNGIPCVNPLQTTEIINHYYETNGILKIELEIKKNAFFCCSNF